MPDVVRRVTPWRVEAACQSRGLSDRYRCSGYPDKGGGRRITGESQQAIGRLEQGIRGPFSDGDGAGDVPCAEREGETNEAIGTISATGPCPYLEDIAHGHS